MMASEDASRPAQPVKFSRYRSVRKAAVVRQPRGSSPPPPIPQQSPRDFVNLQTGTGARERPSNMDAVPQPPEAHWNGQRVAPPVDDRINPTTSSRSRPESSLQAHARVTSDRLDEGSGRRRRVSTSAKQSREDETQLEVRAEDPTPNGIVQANVIQRKQGGTEDEVKRERELREDFLKKQKRRELERLEKELSQAKPVESSPLPSHSKNALSAAFSRRRKRPTTPPKASQSNHKTSSNQREAKEANGIKPGIKPGGGGIVPGIDAPKSAVNSGERVSLFDARVIYPSLIHPSESQDKVW